MFQRTTHTASRSGAEAPIKNSASGPPARSGRWRSRRRDAGLSLVELSVMLSLIGLTMALTTPAVMKVARGSSLDNDASRLATNIRLCRQEATTTGVRRILQWRYSEGDYRIVVDANGNGQPDDGEPFEGPFELSPDITLSNHASEGFSSTYVSIDPSGRASESGTLVLSYNGMSRSVRLLAPLSQVKIQ